MVDDALAGEMFDQIVNETARHRHLAPDFIRAVIDRAPISANEAMRVRLLDRLEYEDQFTGQVKNYRGEHHDLIEFDAEGEPVHDKRQPYLERFIHAAIFEARPDVTAVVHAHAEDTLPFGLVKTPLQPVIHSGSFIGGKVPVWDIRKKFGDTNLLVTNMAQGRDLAKCLGAGNVALMRGHGFASAARSIIEVVRLSVYLPRNARVQMNAMRLGGKPMPLSKGEIAARAAGYKPHSPETWRAWQYWATRAGCGDMIGEPHHHAKAK